MDAIALWLQAFFSSRTLPETMVAIEASEAKFLFSYVFCSLSSLLFSENSTVPQCMTTLTQNARRKLNFILSLTSYLSIGCKNFVCFWLNWFLVFASELSTRSLSCPSVFSSNQLLKSKSLGCCQFYLTVCNDQAS